MKSVLAAVVLSVLSLAGCSSPPEPPEPSGERVAVNPTRKAVPLPAAADQEAAPVLVDDAAPAALTLQPVDVHEFDHLNYRK